MPDFMQTPSAPSPLRREGLPLMCKEKGRGKATLKEAVLPGAFKIAPSILSADFTRLGEQIREAEVGGANLIHCDVMDGHFVPNITFGPMVIEAVRRVTNLPLDVHLMIEKPERYLQEFVQAGATMINVHVETCPHL